MGTHGVQKRASDSPGAGVSGSCERLMWVLEPNSDPLEEQYVLLTMEIFFHPPSPLVPFGRILNF